MEKITFITLQTSRHSLTYISACRQGIKLRFTRFANLKVLYPSVSMVCVSKLKNKKKRIEKLQGGLISSQSNVIEQNPIIIYRV